MSQKRKKHKNRWRQQNTSQIISPTTQAILSNSTHSQTTSNNPVQSKSDSEVSAIDLKVLKFDFLKVFLVVIVITAILIALTLTNDKTGWLNNLADILYRWLKLG